MLFEICWASLGLVFGAFEGFLGALLVLLQAFGGTLNFQEISLGSLPGHISWFLFVSSFAPFLEVVVFLIFEPLGVHLSSQAGPPTLKNLCFIKAGARFSKNQGLGSKDALGCVLGIYWARFGCSWGLLGSSFGAFACSRWPQTLVKHDKSSLPEPQTFVKHNRSSLPEPESSIYS